MDKTVSVRLDEDLREKLNSLKKKYGQPLTWHLRKAIELYLKTVGKDEIN